MGNEIERKFLIKPELIMPDISVIIQAARGRFDIKEHYFNETARLRFMNDRAFITVKSSGTIKRQEYEYEVMPNFYTPMPLMCKTRYMIPHLNHIFELNIFSQIKKGDKPLCLVEVELEDENEEIKFPFWVGEEVTEDKQYYGYNLFKQVKNDYKLGLIK